MSQENADTSRWSDGGWGRLRAAAPVPGWSILQESLPPAQIIQSSAIYRSQLPKARSLFFLGFVPVFN